MNLQHLAIEDIPIGVPLPWRIFDPYGYTVFARGDVVADRKSLEPLLAEGLLRDVDALPEATDAPDWQEIKDLPPDKLFPPQGIKPQVWERLQLRLLGRDAQAFYPARLIGYIKDQSILTTMPEAARQRVDMSDGEPVEVRMLTGGSIYVFQTSVQRLCISPVHYLHLDYPVRVRIQALRRSPWARVDLMGSVANSHGTEEFAHIVNLSPDGAQLHVPAAMGAAGDILRLTFHASIDELKTTLTLDATIRHVRPGRPSGDEAKAMFEYGIAFREVLPEHALWLKCLVYQRIAEGHPA
jgi:hypothetical protein